MSKCIDKIFGKKIFKLQYQRRLNTTSAQFFFVEGEKSGSDNVFAVQKHIEDMKTNPILGKIMPAVWCEAHKIFINHGFSTNHFLQIVIGNPRVLMRSPLKIADTLECWGLCQFGERTLNLLISKHPFLMDVEDKRQFLKQISVLQSHVRTSKNVWNVLMNCPTLVEQSETTIEAKIMYIKEKMHIEISEMVKSAALGKHLYEIRNRHVFMERLGIFRPQPSKAGCSKLSKNPRLYKITDTSEKTFATKVCHVSLEEYEVFKKLYEYELAGDKHL